MSAITAILLGGLTFTLAPVPPEMPPDPLARGYMGITVGTGSLTVERVDRDCPPTKPGCAAATCSCASARSSRRRSIRSSRTSARSAPVRWSRSKCSAAASGRRSR